MIDFSLIKSITIPEGNVTQIADTQGNVLWSAGPPMATVTLIFTFDNSNASSSVVSATVNGTKYTKSYRDADGDGNAMVDKWTLPLEVGTEIILYAKNHFMFSQSGIRLNGTKVANSDYTYTVNGDAVINLNLYYGNTSPSDFGSAGGIDITEQ